MGVANQIADVLRAEKVQVTFFAANERTKEGDGSMGDRVISVLGIREGEAGASEGPLAGPLSHGLRRWAEDGRTGQRRATQVVAAAERGDGDLCGRLMAVLGMLEEEMRASAGPFAGPLCHSLP